MTDIKLCPTTSWIKSNKNSDMVECILWPFARHPNGYGRISSMHYGTKYAHRAICIEVNGNPPSKSHEAAHSCGRGHLGCVNPNHLRWLTPKENQCERVVHGTSNRGSRHGNNKLSADDILFIRGSSMSAIGLANKFRVGQRHIRSIKSGKEWKWL